MNGGYVYIDKGLSYSIIKTIIINPSGFVSIKYEHAFDLAYQALKTKKNILMFSEPIYDSGSYIEPTVYHATGYLNNEGGSTSIVLEINNYVVTITSDQPNEYLIGKAR